MNVSFSLMYVGSNTVTFACKHGHRGPEVYSITNLVEVQLKFRFWIMNLEPLLVKYRTFSALFRHVIVATVKLAGSGTLEGIKIFILNWSHATSH